MRRAKLRRLSEVLVVQFSRYQNPSSRYYPDTITFPATGSADLKYRLVCKIEHTGSPNGGHYYAHVYRRGSWYLVNDSTVSLGTPAPSENTYIAIYHMVAPY